MHEQKFRREKSVVNKTKKTYKIQTSICVEVNTWSGKNGKTAVKVSGVLVMATAAAGLSASASCNNDN